VRPHLARTGGNRCKATTALPGAEGINSGAWRVQQSLIFIERNLSERLSLPEIARAHDLSPYHFVRVFKRWVGLAPHQYVMRRRLERGKELLEDTDLPIAEIALTVGCANQSHFSALFRRVTGMTPMTYRQSKISIYPSRMAR
jgi:AraC family transcriptional regulator